MEEPKMNITKRKKPILNGYIQKRKKEKATHSMIPILIL